MVPDSIPIAHHPPFGAWEHIEELVEKVEVDNNWESVQWMPYQLVDILVVVVEHAPASVALDILRYLS